MLLGCASSPCWRGRLRHIRCVALLELFLAEVEDGGAALGGFQRQRAQRAAQPWVAAVEDADLAARIFPLQPLEHSLEVGPAERRRDQNDEI